MTSLSPASGSSIKRIGILTSGGDCPGLNAAIRSATHAAKEKGWDVVGILNSTEGMMARPIRSVPLDYARVDAVFRMGGTILGTTSKGAQSPLNFPRADGTTYDRSQDVADAYHELGLGGLIVIGGDGSMGILRQIAARTDIKFVGIPKTIDNDVGATDQSIGFDTAMQVATEALDRLQPTAASHQRVMILEVMGRDAGHIALNAGIAGGADVILIPELPYTIECVSNKINKLRDGGRQDCLIVVAEGVKGTGGEKLQVKHMDGQMRLGGIGQYLANAITKETGAEARVTVLGHVQRGAAPSALDRMIATASGVHAVDLIEQGKFDRMVVWKGRGITSAPLSEALDKYHTVDENDSLVQTARSMGICTGS
ncbi:MAG: pfkA [Alphaproteobacteria bacterium]|nr:pfkA [Alphaproteobacteria bacterium]